MSVQYQALLGDTSIDADAVVTAEIDATLAVITNLQTSTFKMAPGHVGYVLTSDAAGTGTWQDATGTLALSGDATGLLNHNIVNTLANGTIPVSNLVTLAGTQTLTNKTITGTTNNVDANSMRNGSTWVVPFSGSAPVTNNILTYNGTNGIWAAPVQGNLTGDITSVGLATTAGANIVQLTSTQTLTNKTMTLPIITSISNSGTMIIPTGGGTLDTIAGVQTLTNKTITGTTNNVDANTLRFGSTYAVPLAGVAPVTNNILTYNGTNAIWSAPAAVTAGNLTGDVTSVGLATTAVKASGNFAVTGAATIGAGASIGALTVRAASQQIHLCPLTDNAEASIAFTTTTLGTSGTIWTMGQGSFGVGAGNFCIGGTGTALSITPPGAVTIPGTLAVTGTTTLNGYTYLPNLLSLGSQGKPKVISIYDNYPSDNTRCDFNGWGNGNYSLNHQLQGTYMDHVFCAATSGTTNTELMRIKGTGAVLVSGLLSTNNQIQYKVISLYDPNGINTAAALDQTRQDFTGIGFGSTSGVVRFQAANTNTSWVWYAATSSTASNPCMTLSGAGAGMILWGGIKLYNGISAHDSAQVSLTNYIEQDFVATFGGSATPGPAITPSMTMKITQVGRVVTFFQPYNFTPVATTSSGQSRWYCSLAIPSQFWPPIPAGSSNAAIATCIFLAINAGASTLCYASLASASGVITLTPTSTASWSGNVAVTPFTLVWSI